MFAKRLLVLALVAAVFGAVAGCGWRRSSCRHDDCRSYEPDCRNYEPCR